MRNCTRILQQREGVSDVAESSEEDTAVCARKTALTRAGTSRLQMRSGVFVWCYLVLLILSVTISLNDAFEFSGYCSKMCMWGRGGNLCKCSAVHFAGKRNAQKYKLAEGNPLPQGLFRAGGQASADGVNELEKGVVDANGTKQLRSHPAWTHAFGGNNPQVQRRSDSKLLEKVYKKTSGLNERAKVDRLQYLVKKWYLNELNRRSQNFT